MSARTGPVVTALIQGSDRRGIIAKITGFIFENNGNIVYLDQHTDTDEEMFFMRVQFALAGFRIPQAELEPVFRKVCAGLGMELRLWSSSHKKRVAVMVSRQGHCITDLLYRWKTGHLEMEIAAVVSNHEDLADLAAYYRVPFRHFPLGGSNRRRRCSPC